ncbi:hypothetical protein NPIL_574881 [Nephila pilipes]|uniref:Uncharacterized protein n=1 Tax=Nephila pilipes TaxID=299642 RepID=A0A8X6MTK9_NEPPI|nr:hypothetical protein NPIL_574881 [Nephila pilipes]
MGSLLISNVSDIDFRISGTVTNGRTVPFRLPLLSQTHSSPSFGSQRVCSGSASCPKTVAGRRCTPRLYAGDPDNK